MRWSNVLRYGFGARGRARKLRKLEQARARKFADPRTWSLDDGLARRIYDSYDDYLAHQAAKLDLITDRLEAREERDFAQFRERFATCRWLTGARSVLCLGARLGTEVRALHSLGYFAVGIDLNPGPANVYVLHGDFHRMVFADSSVDAVYSNAMDHAFDVDQLMTEIRRLLRPQGVLVLDLTIGFGEGHSPGEFEALGWKDIYTLLARLSRHGFDVKDCRALGSASSEVWRQAVLVRRAAGNQAVVPTQAAA
jgi:SAM-dependent methyltransferase